MVKREFYAQRKDGVNLYRTYSDAGLMLQQNETGVHYAEAIDVDGAPYTYAETETPVEASKLTAEEMMAELEAT